MPCLKYRQKKESVGKFRASAISWMVMLLYASVDAALRRNQVSTTPQVCLDALLFLGIFCKLEERLGNMTITSRILLEIVLMILLGSIEVLQRLLLDGQWLPMSLLLLTICPFYRWQVLGIRVINAGTVLTSLVIPLPGDTDGIDCLEKELQQKSEAYGRIPTPPRQIYEPRWRDEPSLASTYRRCNQGGLLESYQKYQMAQTV